jgi:hypothetical protein
LDQFGRNATKQMARQMHPYLHVESPPLESDRVSRNRAMHHPGLTLVVIGLLIAGIGLITLSLVLTATLWLVRRFGGERIAPRR